jgi:hypothetical protein
MQHRQGFHVLLESAIPPFALHQNSCLWGFSSKMPLKDHDVWIVLAIDHSIDKHEVTLLELDGVRTYFANAFFLQFC